MVFVGRIGHRIAQVQNGSAWQLSQCGRKPLCLPVIDLHRDGLQILDAARVSLEGALIRPRAKLLEAQNPRGRPYSADCGRMR
jgi:hypothetical protein